MKEPTLTRRQRERHDREQRFLEIARGILLSEGYLGLTMDKLAAATGYAKGTLYLHFKNKEDLICALLHQLQAKRVELFLRVLDLDLPSRGKLSAVGLAAGVFTMAYPENARIESILRMASVRSKASPERIAALAEVETQCFSVALSIAQSALDAGDLVLPENESIEQLITGLWAMHVGVSMLDSMEPGSCPAQRAIGVFKPASILFPTGLRLLDGYNWRPLSTEFDYAQLRRELLQSHFPAESQRIAEIAADNEAQRSTELAAEHETQPSTELPQDHPKS